MNPPTAVGDASAAGSDPRQAETTTRHAGWSRIKRTLTVVFFAVVGWLLVDNAREIEWRQVGEAVHALPKGHLAIAVALALASHVLYSTYDLVSRAQVGFELATSRIVATTFVSYAFNLNLGSLVGGLGFRYRLYSRQGVDDGSITRTIAFSMWTNWFGYLALAGCVFLLHPFDPPAHWRLSGTSLRVLGALLLSLAIGYLLACAFSPKRAWSLRGHHVELPSLKLALLQLLVAVGNWLLIGAIVWTLLQWRVDFSAALAVLLVAAVAGVITHVPAGVGVLEAVFVTLLAGQLPKNEILGALLAYRAIYYLGPLAVATLVYVRLERGGAALPSVPRTSNHHRLDRPAQ